ncbi:MAG: TonB-dependent receptor [Bacteroidetes bacterium]|nr:TonB-dependent receptor [Bacteroidota bacterium]
MKRIITISLILLSGASVFAQIDSTEKIIQKDEVVIAVNKFEGLKSNAAQQSNVITSNDLRRMNAQSSADVLTMSGQVFVQKSQQGGGSPMLRGFEASRVLLVVDGVRMNNIIYRAGHLQNSITVDNNMVDRVEVLYGPSSTIFGSDALGGVVHFRTKNPILSGEKNFLSKGNAFFRYGTVNNEMTGHMDISLAGKKFGSITSATFSNFGDMHQGSYVTPATAGFWDREYYAKMLYAKDSLGNNRYVKDTTIKNSVPAVQAGTAFYQYDLLQKFLYQQSENITHVLNVQFSNTNNLPRYDRMTAMTSPTTLKDAEWYYGPQRRLLAAYEFNYKNAGWLDNISLGVNYQNIEESRHNRGFGKRFKTSRIEQVNVIGFHADVRKKFGAHDVVLGADGQFNFLKSKAFGTDVFEDTTIAASTRYPDGKNRMNYMAVYLTHQWQISPKLILSDGLRYNFVALHSTLTPESQDFYPLPYSEIKNNYHALSGNVGLVAKPGAGFRLAALFSTGFRAPNVDDMSKVFESVQGSVVVPNSKLKPEYTLNGELTVEKSFSDKLRISATGFYTYFIQAITYDKAQFNGQDSIDYDGTLSQVITSTNEGKAYIAGVSGNIEADLTNWISLYGNVTYTYGRIVTDSVPYPLDHIPPIYGRAGFRAKHKWVRGEFFALFAAKKRLQDFNMLGEDNFKQATPNGEPAWFTLNARIGFQPHKNFGFDMGCDNIMDMRYRSFGSGFSAAGRNFFVTARFNW